MKDFFGVAFLFAGYTGMALLLCFLTGMSLERGLSFAVLYATAQVRWFQRDESPLQKAPTPRQSFMSRIRGE